MEEEGAETVQPGTQKAYILRLYVAGQTRKSLAAFANLKKICEEHLAGRYKIEVIDLLEKPQLAKGDQILAIPTLVRQLPPPLKEDHRRPVQYREGTGGARSTSGRADQLIRKIECEP